VFPSTHLWKKQYFFAGWWFGTFFIFLYIGNFIIPTDELIFFKRGRSTINHQLVFCWGQKMERFFARSQAPSATWWLPALAGEGESQLFVVNIGE